jgi:hypothetical protein
MQVKQAPAGKPPGGGSGGPAQTSFAHADWHGEPSAHRQARKYPIHASMPEA